MKRTISIVMENICDRFVTVRQVVFVSPKKEHSRRKGYSMQVGCIKNSTSALC